MADGSTWTFVSVMENTSDEERLVNPDGMHERKIGKDQVSGAKEIKKTILWGIGLTQAGSVLRAGIASNEAIKLGEQAGKTASEQIAADTTLGLGDQALKAQALELEAAAAVAP